MPLMAKAQTRSRLLRQTEQKKTAAPEIEAAAFFVPKNLGGSEFCPVRFLGCSRSGR